MELTVQAKKQVITEKSLAETVALKIVNHYVAMYDSPMVAVRGVCGRHQCRQRERERASCTV